MSTIEIPKSLNEYINTSQRFSAILSEVIEKLSARRAQHCLNAVKITIDIAEELAFDTEKIKNLAEATLLHDITKEKPKQYHINIVKKYGNIKRLENAPQSIWHGYSGAIYAKNEYKLKKEYCLAIQNHSTGKKGMSDISKILYISDYFESMNIKITSKETSIDLNKWCLIKNQRTLMYLIGKNLPVHIDSIDFYHQLIENQKNHERK